MSRARPLLQSLWYAALSHPLGVYIRTPNPLQLKSLLYSARRDCADPSLAVLQLRTSPNKELGDLWIVNPTPSQFGTQDDSPSAYRQS